MITLLVSIHTGDIDRIFVDKSLVGKFLSETPSDGNICFQFYILICQMCAISARL